MRKIIKMMFGQSAVLRFNCYLIEDLDRVCCILIIEVRLPFRRIRGKCFRKLLKLETVRVLKVQRV